MNQSSAEPNVETSAYSASDSQTQQPNPIEKISLELRHHLASILLESPECNILSEKDVDINEDIHKLGMTSVDFQEFILAVEEKYEFEIAIDELLLGKKIITLQLFAQYIAQHKPK